MSREPVVSAQAIAAAVQAAIMAIVAMAASLGWVVINPEQMGAVERALAALAALAVLVVPQILAAVYARGKVTPTANPHTADGQPAALVPVAQLQAMQAESQMVRGMLDVGQFIPAVDDDEDADA